MTTPRILIAGASIAGPATAFWLIRAGFEVTIIEQSPELRCGGNGVDIRSEALTVIDRMGLTEDVRDRAMVNHGMRFLDRSGRQRVRFPTSEVENMVGSEDIEITRGDLAHLLYAATESDVEYIFGDTVTELNQDGAGVDVTFARTPGRRFDAVIGADGIHSKIRRAAFGPEDDYRVFKQHYYAVVSVDSTVGEPFWTTFYNEPGRSVAIYCDESGHGLLTFTFHSPTPLSYDYRDITAQRHLVREAFAESGWHVPALLDAADTADDFYFDALDQISMPSWSTGRIALVGDAAYCASPASGAGALLALTGAYRLAGELSRTDSPPDAFGRYESAQRPLVAASQNHLFTYITVPRTRFGIAARNIMLSSPIPRMLGRRSSHSTNNLPDYYSRPIK